MYLLQLITDAWPLIIMAAVSLWYFCRAMIPGKDEIVLGYGDDDAKAARMAERASEYQRAHGGECGNWNV